MVPVKLHAFLISVILHVHVLNTSIKAPEHRFMPYPFLVHDYHHHFFMKTNGVHWVTHKKLLVYHLLTSESKVHSCKSARLAACISSSVCIVSEGPISQASLAVNGKG